MKRNITLAGVAAAGALLFTQPASPASVAGVNIAMTNVAVNGCGSIEVYVNLNRSSGLRRRVTLTLSIYRVTASGSLGTRVATGYSSMVQGLRSQKFVNVYRGTTSRANVPILRALHDHRVLSGRQAPSRIGDGVEPWNCSG